MSAWGTNTAHHKWRHQYKIKTGDTHRTADLQQKPLYRTADLQQKPLNRTADLQQKPLQHTSDRMQETPNHSTDLHHEPQNVTTDKNQKTASGRAVKHQRTFKSSNHSAGTLQNPSKRDEGRQHSATSGIPNHQNNTKMVTWGSNTAHHKWRHQHQSLTTNKKDDSKDKPSITIEDSTSQITKAAQKTQLSKNSVI